MKKLLLLIIAALLLVTPVHAAESLFSFSGGDLADFVHNFGWREEADKIYYVRLDNDQYVMSIANFQGGTITAQNKSRATAYDITLNGGTSFSLQPGETRTFSRSSTYKGMRVDRRSYQPPDPKPDPKPDPEPDPKPNPKPTPKPEGDLPMYNIFNDIPIDTFWNQLFAVLSLGMPLFLIFAAVVFAGAILKTIPVVFSTAAGRKKRDDDEDDDW